MTSRREFVQVASLIAAAPIIGKGVKLTKVGAFVLGHADELAHVLKAVGEGAPLYHRIESPTQTPLDALNQIRSGELWGQAARYSDTPSAKAYSGALPEGERGVEFTTTVPPDPGGAPGLVNWSGPRPGVELRGDYAAICIVVTKNTQC